MKLGFHSHKLGTMAPAIIPDIQEAEVRPLRAEGHSNLQTFTDRFPGQSELEEQS